ncbi:aspartate-alanine antiporter [Catellatospora methionotrophica]|uniref:Aspartate-alanine antiporter n=1 Tax=Catellatospora methionotrophica TaxID=121620 RepID=A0A8J3LP41_9ACTN|nr:aspartate-alanine antiporter [Catellatospora methionotrophica]GIG16305.1 aspartate-alanine antiporter [Catellatospora methionotrophica]
MLDWLGDLLRSTPGLALFGCLAAGFALGRVRFWRITLGGVAGTLLVALIVGLLDVTLTPELRNVAFALFIFTLGYLAGPSFFASLNRRALRYAVFTVIQVTTLVALVCVATVALGLDQGTAAGLLAGGTTSSSVLGTAGEAIGALPVGPERVRELQSNLATAYSIAYIFSLVTLILFTSQFVPMLMRVDLREQARELWRKLGGEPERSESTARAVPGVVGRVYVVDAAHGLTLAQLTEALGTEAAVERLRRDGEITEAAPETVLRAGDRLVVVGEREALLRAERLIGPETLGTGNDPLSLDVAEVVITDRRYRGWTLEQLHRQVPPRGVFVTGLSRMEHALPVKPWTDITTGDTVRLTGAGPDLDAYTPLLGIRINPAVKADLSFIALGVVVGMLIGRLSMPVGGVPLSLGIGGGCLFSGLFFGWLRARHPTYGQYHPAAAQVIQQFGLATFVCAVGLGAGPGALTLIERYGVLLPLVAVLVTAIPALLSLWAGSRLMRLPAPLVAGAIAGQQCSTPAVDAVREAAGNTTPLLSYTIVYAFSAVLLPLLGPLIVALSSALVAA